MIELLFVVIVLGLFAWVVTSIPMPQPFQTVAYAILILILVIFVFRALGVAIPNLR